MYDTVIDNLDTFKWQASLTKFYAQSLTRQFKQIFVTVESCNAVLQDKPCFILGGLALLE